MHYCTLVSHTIPGEPLFSIDSHKQVFILTETIRFLSHNSELLHFTFYVCMIYLFFLKILCPCDVIFVVLY